MLGEGGGGGGGGLPCLSASAVIIQLPSSI